MHLARAFAQEASIVLLDEPTANLDPRHQLTAMRLLRDFVARGGSALVVLHDLTLAARNSDRLLVLERGRIRAEGPPASALVESLLGEVFGVRARVGLDARGEVDHVLALEPDDTVRRRQVRQGRQGVIVIALVLGGARSGKSRYAMQVASALTAAPIMLATSRVYDADHAARIARHKADRGPEWTTIEEPTAIARPSLAGHVVVVDCVTLWLTNFFADADWKATPAHEAARQELARTFAIDATWIFVSNELGMAPHAATDSARKFVDIQGFLNQEIAARADAVTLMVAGIPLAVKGGDLRQALREGQPQ